MGSSVGLGSVRDEVEVGSGGFRCRVGCGVRVVSGVGERAGVGAGVGKFRILI